MMYLNDPNCLYHYNFFKIISVFLCKNMLSIVYVEQKELFCSIQKIQNITENS